MISSPVALAEGLLKGALVVSAGGSVGAADENRFPAIPLAQPVSGAGIHQPDDAGFHRHATVMEDGIRVDDRKLRDQPVGQCQRLAGQGRPEFAAYQSQTGIVDVPQNAQSMITQLAQYETQRTTLSCNRKPCSNSTTRCSI